MRKAANRNSLLSRLALFVRHPTTPWSELGRHIPSPEAVETMQTFRESMGAQDRSVLQAALEAKRRSDKVRDEEFNLLRQVRQRSMTHAAAPSAVAVHPQVPEAPRPLLPVQPVPIDGQQHTMAKIARIEAQMAGDWPGRDRATPVREGHVYGGAHSQLLPVQGNLTSSSHLAPRLDTLPISAAGSAAGTAPPLPVNEVQDWSVVEEAVIRHASGDEAAVEALLRTAMAAHDDRSALLLSACTLLDWLCVQGAQNAFEQVAMDMAVRCAVSVPRWPAPSAGLANQPKLTLDGVGSAANMWVCPPFLDLQAVQALQDSLVHSGREQWMDWGALNSADINAAQALLEQVQAWSEQPFVFHFDGAEVLRRRLKSSTPSGRRENEGVWWHLRLALLRLMHRMEEYELVALDYCVTYGVMPPMWSPPVNSYQSHEGCFKSRCADGASAGPAQLAQAALSGIWQADGVTPLVELQQMGASLAPDTKLRVDCTHLHRIDFAAAGMLMQGCLAAQARNIGVELVEVNRLVAGFLHVVGIDEMVPVRLRQY
jgi:ABC-type transporter Mla MlaB component